MIVSIHSLKLNLIKDLNLMKNLTEKQKLIILLLDKMTLVEKGACNILLFGTETVDSLSHDLIDVCAVLELLIDRGYLQQSAATDQIVSQRKMALLLSIGEK